MTLSTPGIWIHGWEGGRRLLNKGKQKLDPDWSRIKAPQLVLVHFSFLLQNSRQSKRLFHSRSKIKCLVWNLIVFHASNLNEAHDYRGGESGQEIQPLMSFCDRSVFEDGKKLCRVFYHKQSLFPFIQRSNIGDAVCDTPTLCCFSTGFSMKLVNSL